MGVDRKANSSGRGAALERSHGASLEPLAQLGDALRGVGASPLVVKAAELVTGQAAKLGKRVSMTESIGSRFESQAAYMIDCSVEFPLRPSARAAPPLGPSLFQARLRARGNGGGRLVSMGADKKANTRGQRRT